MSVKFFGQFLIERCEIDSGHLQQALDYMESVNLPLGQLAVGEGMLTGEAADRVNERQRQVDRPFGVLAVEMGLLEAEQVENLLRRQAQRRIRIGEALVRVGALRPERLAPLLDEYKADQAPYQAGHAALPPALEGRRAAEVIVDFLPKFCLRVARMRLKVGDHREVSAAPRQRHRVSIALKGSSDLEIGLACDREFALPIAAATCFEDASKLDDELVVDGLGEFLNVLAGNAISALEKENIHANLGPPRLDASWDDGWEFETASAEGEAWLVLRPL